MKMMGKRMIEMDVKTDVERAHLQFEFFNFFQLWSIILLTPEESKSNEKICSSTIMKRTKNSKENLKLFPAPYNFAR